MGSNQYWVGRFYDLCVYFMTGTPEGSTESGFMEKPGIEPVTLGLQGIALIHYTTAASCDIFYIKWQPETPSKNPNVLIKETKSATTNIFRKKIFSF